MAARKNTRAGRVGGECGCGNPGKSESESGRGEPGDRRSKFGDGSSETGNEVAHESRLPRSRATCLYDARLSGIGFQPMICGWKPQPHLSALRATLCTSEARSAVGRNARHTRKKVLATSAPGAERGGASRCAAQLRRGSLAVPDRARSQRARGDARARPWESQLETGSSVPVPGGGSTGSRPPSPAGAPLRSKRSDGFVSSAQPVTR